MPPHPQDANNFFKKSAKRPHPQLLKDALLGWRYQMPFPFKVFKKSEHFRLRAGGSRGHSKCKCWKAYVFLHFLNLNWGTTHTVVLLGQEVWTHG